MKHHIRLGVVCLARKSFDYEAAKQIFTEIQKNLKAIENITWVMNTEVILEPNEARKVALHLQESNIDGFVCVHGTFHLGNLLLEIIKILHKPILLWGLEELPYTGGKIRLNSVCAMNLNASNLYKSGVRNYHYTIGKVIDEDWVDAIRIISALRSSRVGIAGHHALGFFNLDINELETYRALGVLLDHYELQEIYDTKTTDDQVEKKISVLKSIFKTTGISQEQLIKVGQLAAKLEIFLDKYELTALALRCWPEFATDFGITPCASMSLLQADGRIIACEGDVEGACTMIAQTAIGGKTPFLADLSQVDFNEDSALLWHCGVAPCNLWDGNCQISLDTYHSGGKGVTADFVMKSGDISVARMDSAGLEKRLFLARAHGVPMTKDLKGTYIKVVFNENAQTLLGKVINNGIAHHVSVVYGDFIRPFEIFASIMGWKVV